MKQWIGFPRPNSMGARASRSRLCCNAANETTPAPLADECRLRPSRPGRPALSAVATGSESFSSDQATTRSACSTLPLVSGARTSERAKLSAPTQVPIIIGIA